MKQRQKGETKMTKRDYTPAEITKVIIQIITTQKTKGYKPMWAKKEMERRAEKAERKGSFYACGTDGDKLGWACYHIANGEQEIGDVEAALKEDWEMYQEMVAQYS